MKTKIPFGLFMFFCIALFSYTPLKTEIHELAINETLTTPIYVFIDSWFGLLFSVFIVIILTIAIYELSKS